MNTKIDTTFVILGIVAAFTLTGIVLGVQSFTNATAQAENPSNEIRTILVTGSSSDKVSPDRVTISFAVESQNKTAQQATQTNAKITNLVIEALKASGVTESELSTSYYNVYPVYEYASEPVQCTQVGQDQAQKYCPPTTQKQTLIGYKASDAIQIESAQLDKVGQWIDAAVGAGANRVDYLYFFVSDQTQNEIRDRLIADAIQDAHNKAEIALGPLGMKIIDVQSINLQNYPIIYQRRGYESSAGAPTTSTPIIPGEQVVSTTIQATFVIEGYSGKQAQTNSTVHTSVSKEFNITLNSNPSTGYGWHVKGIDASTVKLINDQYISPESGLVGASGKQVLSFQALREGNTTITLEYVRPWEPDKPASVYSVNVVISTGS